MKPYRDMFGNNLTKTDIDLAARIAVRDGKVTPFSLSRSIGHTGIAKAQRMIAVLADAGVVSKTTAGPYATILKNADAAVNAALRQLKKGKVKA